MILVAGIVIIDHSTIQVKTIYLTKLCSIMYLFMYYFKDDNFLYFAWSYYLGFGRSKSQHSMRIIGPMQRISRQHIFHIRVFFSVIYSLTQMFSDPSPLLTDEIILARSKGFNLQTIWYIPIWCKSCVQPWGHWKKTGLSTKIQAFQKAQRTQDLSAFTTTTVGSFIKDQFQNIDQTTTQIWTKFRPQSKSSK